MVMRPRTSWISAETWQLVDEKAARRRQLNPDQAVIRRLSRRIAASLRADRKRRVEAAGSAIESALQGKDLQEAWNIFKCWYRHAGDRAPRPSRQDLESVTADRVALYSKEEPQGPPIVSHERHHRRPLTNKQTLLLFRMSMHYWQCCIWHPTISLLLCNG